MPRDPDVGPGPCGVMGCGRAAWARGLCPRHYQADYRRRGPPCSRRNCPNPSFAKGMCVRHYQEEYRHRGGPCRKRTCPNLAFSRGLCIKHYHRWYQSVLREHGVASLKVVPPRALAAGRGRAR